MTATAAAKSFSGKSALITGASSGIGRALAERLARDGARLALVGRDPARLNAAAAACRGAGSPKAEAYPFDLRDSARIAEMVGGIKRDFGGAPDVLIHAAGTATVGLLEETPVAAVGEVLAVNLLAAMALAAALVPDMRKRGQGLLVFITSGTAHFGVPTEAAYCASKAGLERFAESLRGELLGSGVLVSVVSPGPAETPLMRSPQTYGPVRPIGRPKVAAQPHELAERIVSRLGQGTEYIELSARTRLVRHLRYWAPALLRRVIERQSRRENGAQSAPHAS